MIEISPSILTNSIEEFKRFVKAYEIFDSVDIDIIRKPFLPNETADLADTISFLKNSKIKSLGFHFMVDSPEEYLELLKKNGFKNRTIRIYLQQESDIKFLNNYDWPSNWRRGVSIKLETKLKNIDFYNKFNEVQFMSIDIGGQGRPFQESVLDKIEEIKEIGYNGIISLDGGINLKTANIVKQWDIQRVSPGSYFAKAEDIELARMKLELALNIKTSE